MSTIGRGVWWLSFLIFAFMGVLWSLSTAPMGSPDEPAHALKAVAISRGQFTTEMDLRGNPKFLLVPITQVRVPEGYASLYGVTKCWVTNLNVPASCAPLVSNGETVVDSTTYVGAYPPLYYALVGWPSHLMAARTGVYGMRVTSALLCAALLASGLTSAVRMSARRVLVAGCAMAITPMVLFLGGSINPNAVEIAAAFCFWASLLAVMTRPDAITTRLVVRATVAGVLLASTRSLSPAFVVIIATVVLLMAADRQGLGQLWADRRIRVATGILILGVLGSAAFLVLNHSFEDRFRFARPESITRADVARQSFEHTGRHLEQAVGTLGWIGFGRITLPRVVIDGWIVAVSGLGVIALAVGRWRERLVLITTAAGCLALPVVTETVTLRGFGWQGRYVLPLAVGVPILSGWVVDRSGRVARRTELAMVVAVAVTASIAYVVAHQTMMTRNTVGLPNGLFDGLGEGVWHGPLTPLTLFACAIVGSLVYAGWLTVLATRRLE